MERGDLVKAFAAGFDDEASKLGMDKKAFMDLLLGGGATLAGARAFMGMIKPNDLSFRQWDLQGKALNVLGATARAAAMPLVGVGTAMSGLSGPSPFPFRPPSISGLGPQALAGAF